MTHSRTRWRAPIALMAAAIVVMLFAGPASSQDDPYGVTSTTAPPVAGEPACDLGLTVGAPGTTGSVVVTNVPFGATVRILLGGVEVGRATAPVAGQSAGMPVVFNGATQPVGANATTLAVPFTVPDLEPGFYLVTAVGAGFTITCDNASEFEILGSSQGGGSGGTALPRTGIYVGLFLVVAVVLLLVGRALVTASRRRQQAARRTSRTRRPAEGSLERTQK